MDARMHVTFAAQKVELKQVKKLMVGMNAVAREYVATVRRLMIDSPATGRQYGNHRASAPGQPPAPDTGDLVRSIEWRLDTSNWGWVTANVGSRLKYALFLEYGAAKGVRERPRGAVRKKWTPTGEGRITQVQWILFPRPAWGPAMLIVRPKIKGIIAAAMKKES